MSVAESNLSSISTRIEFNEIQKALYNFEKKDLQKAMKDTVGIASRLLRKEIEPKLSTQYRLRSTKDKPQNIKSYKLTREVGRNGVRSIGYYLHGTRTHKWANVYIKILNWYEEDVTVNPGASGRKSPYVRLGTHFFRDTVSSIAPGKLNEAVDIVVQELNGVIREYGL